VQVKGLFAAGAVIAAVIAASAAARADFRVGSQLLQECTSLSPAAHVFCIGYVAAIFDASKKRPKDLPGTSLLGFVHCAQKSVTNEQQTDAVVQFLRTHTEHQNYGAAGLVAHALAEAYPCK
jgi:hypothetical protein